MHLDTLDRKLISALKDDGRLSFTQLAVKLDVAENTARNRLNRLVESGTIRIGPIVDQTKIGYRLNVWLGISCQPGTLRTVAHGLAEYHAVRYVGSCTGVYDVICEAVFLSQAEMLSFLEVDLSHFPSITRTDSSVVLEITKLGYEWELREEDNTDQQPGGNA